MNFIQNDYSEEDESETVDTSIKDFSSTDANDDIDMAFDITKVVFDSNDSANVNEFQENQSARSLKTRHSRRNSKISNIAKTEYKEVDELETLPVGCNPLFLSAATLEEFSIVIDESISAQRPLVTIGKESILADIIDKGALSDFNLFAEVLNNYDEQEILLAYDPNHKFGENFILASTESAKNELTKMLIISNGDNHDMITGHRLAMTDDFIAPITDHWMCLGSDRDIIENHVILNRPMIRTMIERLRREFGIPVEFTEKSSSKDYVEVRKFEDISFSLRVSEQDKCESNTPQLKSVGSNTTWPYPRNAHTQYLTRAFGTDECDFQFHSDAMMDNIRSVMPYVVESLQHNEIANYFIDDYGTLAPGDNVFDIKTNNDLREFQTFADLKYGKEKAITEIQWHPTIKGIIATSLSEKCSFDQRIDNLSKIILAKSYIIFWSFLDPIQPQILLEAPADIVSFKFNYTDPQFVAGGCINGQIVLWDMEIHMDDLRNVKARMKLRNVIPLFSFDSDTSPKIPSLRPSAVSHTESSHSAPITDIKWLPDHYEVNNLGYSLENLNQKCVQIATAAGDNKILFWDIRVNKAITSLPDKSSMAIPTALGVPETFKYLDMKWKPTLRVHVYKSGLGGDFAPTKFSLKEVQGDRHVLDSLEDKENKQDDTIKSNIPKARTLQTLNTHIFVGTEDGEIVYVDWMPQKDTDTGKLQTQKPDHFWNIHDGPITCVTRCPFDRSLILVIGGWIWSLWKEEVISGPIIQSCTSPNPLTNGTWSPTKASVFFITRADGCVEIWDILDKTHEPSLTQNISSIAALTSISVYNFVKKQLVAIGDINGGLHVYEVPQRFKQHSPSELLDTGKYIDREVRRRDFVQRRWNLREQEKIEKEIENKKKAGIAPQVILTDDEVKARMKENPIEGMTVKRLQEQLVQSTRERFGFYAKWQYKK